jgi:hypothetical protein
MSLVQLFPYFSFPCQSETSDAPVNRVFNSADVGHKLNIKTTFTSSRLIEKERHSVGIKTCTVLVKMQYTEREFSGLYVCSWTKTKIIIIDKQTDLG